VLRDTGKNHLTNLLLAKIHSHKKVALTVASLGIAAMLLNDRWTAHSTFKLLLYIKPQEESVCSIRKINVITMVIQKAVILFWDG
jgi:hypothetical protein